MNIELTTEELWDLVEAAEVLADNNEDDEQADRYTALADKLREKLNLRRYDNPYRKRTT